MQDIGFEDAYEFLQAFLYYDQQTGKLKSTKGGRVIPSSGSITIPIKEGVRDKKISIQMEDKRASYNVGPYGIERNQIGNEKYLKHIKDETYLDLVKFANEFLADIYNNVLHPTIINLKEVSVKQVDKFQRFIITNNVDELPI